MKIKEVVRRIETGDWPRFFVEGQKSSILALWNAGKVREAQRLFLELLEPKAIKRTLL